MKRIKRDEIGQQVSNPQVLRSAWKQVRASAGGPGIDQVTIERFEASYDRELSRIAETLRQEAYRFSRLRKARIPKENGGERQLGIPTIADRIVLQAMRSVLEPACEARMHDCSHAYRPGRGAMTALDAIARGMTQGLQYVLETDIESFFDSIEHRSLLRQLERMEPQAKGSGLVSASLRLSAGRWGSRKGVSQGSPLSPLLANVALTSFDRALDNAEWTVVRYADDLVILCRSAGQTESALATAKHELASIGLRLHPDKTRIVDSRRDSFRFLGFEFHPDRVVPDAANLARLRDNVAAWCNPHRLESWDIRLENINALLRSFAWYYHQTDSRRLFWTLDQYVREQLEQLEVSIGAPEQSWKSRLVKMATMREVHWRGKNSSKKSAAKKRRSWNGYG